MTTILLLWAVMRYQPTEIIISATYAPRKVTSNRLCQIFKKKQPLPVKLSSKEHFSVKVKNGKKKEIFNLSFVPRHI